MRFILRLLLTLVGIVAFIAMIPFGALYAYGQYGAPLIQTQLQGLEDQIEEDLEEEYPGSEVTVDVKEIFYKLEGGMPVVAFEINAIAELADVEVENTTKYVILDIMSVVTGNPEFDDYEESEWEDMEEDFSIAPSMIFDGNEAKSTATTYLIIAAAVFVGTIVVKIVFLRKKRL